MLWSSDVVDAPADADADDDDVNNDDCGFFGFLVNVDVGDVDNDNVGVPIRSIFCIAIVLVFFGDDVKPVAVDVADGESITEGDANILLFIKGHP